MITYPTKREKGRYHRLNSAVQEKDMTVIVKSPHKTHQTNFSTVPETHFFGGAGYPFFICLIVFCRLRVDSVKGYKSAALFLQEALEERVEVVKAAGAKSDWAGGMSYDGNVRFKEIGPFLRDIFFWVGNRYLVNIWNLERIPTLQN